MRKTLLASALMTLGLISTSAAAGEKEFSFACKEFLAGKKQFSDTRKGANFTAGAILELTKTKDCAAAWSALQKMETIDLSGKGIDDISLLSALMALKELNVSNNAITTLTGLDGMNQLEKLDMNTNQISDISLLATIPTLKNVDLANNKVTDLAPLAKLKDLRQLRLNGNQIEKVGDLDGNKELRKLWLSDNKIKNITPISGLPNLEEIAIKKNPITEDGCPTGKTATAKDKEVEVNEKVREVCKAGDWK